MTCHAHHIRYVCSSGIYNIKLTRWLLFACIAALQACAVPFDLQGHRGARGLAPENTLAAFDRALDVGVSTLELDIAITADKIAVISHDPALLEAITRDAQGRWLPAKGPLISRLSLAELQSHDVGRANPESPYGKQFPQQTPSDGERVPTLAALFKRVQERGAHHVKFNIETKIVPSLPHETVAPQEFVDTLLATINAAHMARRVTIQSFDWRTLQLVQKQAPGIPTVYLSVEGPNFNNVADGSWSAGLKKADFASVPHMVKAAGGAVWSPNFNNLTEALVKQSKALALPVIPWTVNSPADMDRLVKWGVDGIITDYPDRLRQVMQANALALPPALSPMPRNKPASP